MNFENTAKRLLKYLAEGLAVAVASRLLTSRKISLSEVALIGLTAALTFLVLDTLAPSIAPGARQGAGFGLGYQGVTMTGAPAAIVAGVEPFANMSGGGAPESSEVEGPETPAPVPGPMAAPIAAAPVEPAVAAATKEVKEAGKGCEWYYMSDNARATAEGGMGCGGATTALTPPCFKTSPIVHNVKQCQCTMGCKGCGPELECPVNCAPKQCNMTCCNIESTGCPYKIIPGQYSHQVILPGYNECVKPYNFYQKWK